MPACYNVSAERPEAVASVAKTYRKHPLMFLNFLKGMLHMLRVLCATFFFSPTPQNGAFIVLRGLVAEKKRPIPICHPHEVVEKAPVRSMRGLGWLRTTYFDGNGRTTSSTTSNPDSVALSNHSTNPDRLDHRNIGGTFSLWELNG